MFLAYFERENKILTFNIIHFPNFEICASPLISSAPLNVALIRVVTIFY